MITNPNLKFSITESCNATCLNGGICTKSNECLCRKGFWGTQCENDLDECASNLHHCDTSSDCVNMPGWYYCKCKTGYKATFENNSISLQVHCEGNLKLQILKILKILKIITFRLKILTNAI